MPEPEGLPRQFFPLFIPMDGRIVVVVGGGKIATRRVATLIRFACRVRVVAPEISEQLAVWADEGRIDCQQASYSPAVLNGADLVVAATDLRAVNRQVGEDARERGLWVSVCDRKAECTFYFPAIIEHDTTVIGLSSEGQSTAALPGLVQRLREILNNLGPMTK